MQSSWFNPSSGKLSFMVERSVLVSPRKRALKVALMVLSPGFVVLLTTPIDNSETISTPTSDGPKQILSHGFSIEKIAVDIDNLSINDVIHGEAIFPHHISISAATNMATHSNSCAHTAREAMHIAFVGNCIVNFSCGGSNFNPSSLILNANINRSKVKHVKDKEWHLWEAFIHGGEKCFGVSEEEGVEDGVYGLVPRMCRAVDRYNFEPDEKNNPKAVCPATGDGPKQVVSHGFSIKKVAADVDQLSINDVIHTEAIFPHHISVSAATNITTHSHSWAHTAREAMHIAFVGNCIVNFSYGGSNFNPSSLILNANINRSKVKHVKDKEWHI
nr:hypothetical protein JCGZ_11143 [Ipomoea batatas]